MKPFSVLEVLEGAAELAGQQATVQGMLNISPTEAFLTAEDEDPERAEARLPVDHPGLLDAFLGCIPPWVGGPFFYSDPARVTGVIKVENQEGKPLLTDVLSIYMVSDDTPYRLDF